MEKATSNLVAFLERVLGDSPIELLEDAEELPPTHMERRAVAMSHLSGSSPWEYWQGIRYLFTDAEWQEMQTLLLHYRAYFMVLEVLE